MLSRSPNNYFSRFHTIDRSSAQSQLLDANYERRHALNSNRYISASASNHSYDGPASLTQAKYTSKADKQTNKQSKNDIQAQNYLIDDGSGSNKMYTVVESKEYPRFDNRTTQLNDGKQVYSNLINRKAHHFANATVSQSTNLSKQDKIPESRQKNDISPLNNKRINYTDRAGTHTHSFSTPTTINSPSQSYDSHSVTPASNSGNSYTNNRDITKNSTASKEFASSIKSQPLSAKLSPKNLPPNSIDANSNKIQTDEPKTLKHIPNYEPTRHSAKNHGIIRAYAANTNQGLIRNYNEDRVSIILNINKPANRTSEKWPKCSFFGVFDGHGGNKCADFLRDNLHQFVVKEPSFPSNPKEAIIKGFEAAEKSFLELAQSNPSGEIDRSGSCAVVALIVGDMCHVANVGDSRAVMSGDAGRKVFSLSRDHKPLDEIEQKRIIDNGGKIYQSQTPILKSAEEGKPQQQTQIILGPHRVFPGRLSVTRAFGDIEAKLPKLGGAPGVVVATPDVKSFKIIDEHDFIIIACDGIFDKLTSKDVVRAVWKDIEEKVANDIHQQSAQAVDSVLLEAINRKTSDNITVVCVAFKNFEEKVFGESYQNENTDSNRNGSYKKAQNSQQKGKSYREVESASFGMTGASNLALAKPEEKQIVSYLNKAKEEKPALRLGEWRQGTYYNPKSEINYLLNPDVSQKAHNKITNS